jgi:hypothetical protein
MLGLTGLRMDRSVPGKTIDVAGVKEVCALLVEEEELNKGPPHIRALVDAAFTASTSLRRAEVRGHDCVALPLVELC